MRIVDPEPAPGQVVRAGQTASPGRLEVKG
jgi:hypothetical protein